MRLVPIPLLLLIVQLALFPARAEDASATATDAVPSPVGLDDLFRLPPQSPKPQSAPAGLSDQKEWKARFDTARAELEAAREALASSQNQLSELASDGNAWQMAPPGAQPNPENSPLSYKLRQDIRRQREDVAQAERALQDLRIEANLAGVPQEWQD